MARKTANERHALSGLLRFREFSDGMLYAPANPVCNVVPLLASHFAARLPKERWVIHDVNRREGVFYEKGKALLVHIDGRTYSSGDLSEKERAFSSLWKTFYKTVAIESRHNEDLCKQNMPKRYWPWLVENP